MGNGTANNDTFLAKLSGNNYIDSLKNIKKDFINSALENSVSIIRGVNSRLYYSTSFLNYYMYYNPEDESNILTSRTNYIVYNLSNNNLKSYVGFAIRSIFNHSYNDSLSYNLARPNQQNLPDQFITNMQSYYLYQGKPILTPMFLLQQSNIYPYRSHTNLINKWDALEVFLPFSPYPSTTPHTYTYNYTLDGLSRVTQMDVSVNGTNYLTYQFEYFN